MKSWSSANTAFSNAAPTRSSSSRGGVYAEPSPRRKAERGRLARLTMIQAIVYTVQHRLHRRICPHAGRKDRSSGFDAGRSEKEPACPRAHFISGLAGWPAPSELRRRHPPSFPPRAVCGVGLTLTPSKKLREQNHIPQTVTVFSLQGGFDMERLHGLDKLLMKILRASLQSSMAKKRPTMRKRPCSAC